MQREIPDWPSFPSLFLCPGDRVRQTENRATRCKVERLQLLMQQKRLRRKARRDQRAPYQWLPNRKAGRSNSNSSMSSEGSLDLDFDDSVWKPDVKADLKSEFVMAWSVWSRTLVDRFKDVQSIAWDLLWYILREWIGRRWHRTVQRCLVQRGNQSCPCDWRPSHGEKKRLPADFNPILSFTVDLVKHSDNNNWTFFWCLDLDRQQLDLTVYKTFYGMITETIPELEHSRIQWVVVVVVFSDFVF